MTSNETSKHSLYGRHSLDAVNPVPGQVIWSYWRQKFLRMKPDYHYEAIDGSDRDGFDRAIEVFDRMM